MSDLKKCILAPDSFKGTLSAVQVCNVMEREIKREFPDCRIIKIPVADGGEGTTDCFLSAWNAPKTEVTATGPFMEKIKTGYALCHENAVMEIASVAGLPMAEGHTDVLHATTYGLGALVRDAVTRGCRELTIGLGGSCTNDAGIGAACALGARFYDKSGKQFMPAANQMTEIGHLDLTETQKLLRPVKITAMCDINNPMYGENGAAFVFAPQKGANPEEVRLLDENLRALSDLICRETGKDVSSIPGAGAAGAMGAGIMAFLGGTLRSGIETVLELTEFDRHLEETDLVITGEGKIDSQSLQGKVLSGILVHAGRKKVPVIIVAGSAEPDSEKAYQLGAGGIFTINRKAVDFAESRFDTEQNLSDTMHAIMQFRRLS